MKYSAILLFVLLSNYLVAQNTAINITKPILVDSIKTKLKSHEPKNKVSFKNATKEKINIIYVSKDSKEIRNIVIVKDSTKTFKELDDDAINSNKPLKLKIVIGKDTTEIWEQEARRSSQPVSKSEAETTRISFVPKNDPISDNCIGCSQDSKQTNIEYDLQCQKVVFPLNKSNKTKMLKIGSIVNITPYSYNPYRDSLSVSVQFEDKNMEQQSLFSQFFVPSTNTPSTKKEETPGTSTAEGQVDDDWGSERLLSQSDKIELLVSQLTEYYSRLTSLPNINTKSLDGQLNEIFGNINNVFSFNPKVNNEDNLEVAFGTTIYDKDRENLKKIVQLLKQIKQYRKISFPPIQIQNADFTKISFEYYRDGKKLYNPSYTFFNKGGFKLDFSSGLFGTGLIDHQFSTKAFSTFDTTRIYKVVYNEDKTVAMRKDSITGFNAVSKQRLFRNNDGDFNIGLGVLLHAYSRWGKRVNVGVSVGGIIDNTSKLKYLLGGSLLLGREQRFILSGGLAYGKVTRLSDSLKEGDIVPDSNVATIQKSMRSWYFGINYNLGNLVSASSK